MTKIIHYEPTSRCNAACPMCARNVNGQGCVVPLQDLSLELFQTQISSCLGQLEKVFFCGAVGDPCADKTLLEKIQWLKQQQKDIVVGINTNGSIRNPTWWTQCGELLNGVFDYVVFSIDGLEDTNHIYRVGVQYKKIMENAQAYIATGASAHWDMLVFDHNKHQINTCKQLANSMGFSWFRSKETDRWDQFDLGQIKPVNNPKKIDYHSIDSIQCERNIEQSTYIDHRGQEFPCCHIGEMYYSTTQVHDNQDILNHTPQELMSEYQTRLDNNNAFYTCKRSCGLTVGKQSQWKQEVQLR